MLALLLTLLALAAYLVYSGLPLAAALLACALVMMALLQFRLRSNTALLWLAALSLIGAAGHYLPGAAQAMPGLAVLVPLLPWLQIGVAGAAIGYALGFAWSRHKAARDKAERDKAGAG